MAYKEYKVITVVEGAFDTLLFGASRLPVEKMERAFNEEAAEGWQVVFQIVVHKRMLLFWKREAVIVTLGR